MHETSVRELTGLDPGLEPFFETAWRNHYGSLWVPTEVNFRDSHWTYLSSSLLNQGENSWFMVWEGFTRMSNSERICSASFTYFCADNTERNEEPHTKRQKKPRTLQEAPSFRGESFGLSPRRSKEILCKYLEIHRNIYNECGHSERGGNSRYQCGRNAQGPQKNIQKGELRGEKTCKDELPTLPPSQTVAEYFRAKKATPSNFMAGNKSSDLLAPST